MGGMGNNQMTNQGGDRDFGTTQVTGGPSGQVCDLWNAGWLVRPAFGCLLNHRKCFCVVTCCMCPNLQGVLTNKSSNVTNRDVNTTQENTTSNRGGLEVSVDTSS